MKQVQSYANAVSDTRSVIDARRSLVDHGVGHYARSRDVVSENVESCTHDYQGNWRCSKCGYALTKQLRGRIDQVTRYATR